MKNLVYVLLLSLSLIGHTKEVEIFYSNYAPYEFQGNDANAVGFSVDVVKAIAKEARIPIKFVFYPWKRGVMMLNETINSGLISSTRNEKREASYKWVGPIISREISIYKLRKSNFDLDISTTSNKDALADILSKKYQIGAISGYASQKDLISEGYTVVTANNPESDVKRLFRERYPLVVNTDLIMAFKTRQIGKKFTDIQKVAIHKSQYSFYIMFNKNTSYEILYKFQEALGVIKYNGVYDKILKKWIN